jgi:hypothetical protein
LNNNIVSSQYLPNQFASMAFAGISFAAHDGQVDIFIVGSFEPVDPI